MALYTETNRRGDWLKRRFLDPLYHYEPATLASGQNLTEGTVVGAVLLGSASETHAGNTGNGAMTLDATTPVLAGAKVGVYNVKCITAATNSGTFRVTDPDGIVLGDVAVAATFANKIKFVIADGAADFIVGDTFLVTVAAGSGKLKALAPSANDGTQIAIGILLNDCDASGGDKPCVYVARGPAIYAAGQITWPNGISAGAKATAIAQLNALNIIGRTEL